MQPELKVVLVTAITGLIVAMISGAVAIIAARIGNNTRVLLLEVKNQMLSFENTFVDRLNGRYIRKPDQPEDYPMSKAEGRSIERKVDAAASIFEAYRKDVHERFDAMHRDMNLKDQT